MTNWCTSIDELSIHGDSTELPSSYYALQTAEYYQNTSSPYAATFDTKRNVKNPPVTWRYENPGNADLLTQAGTTITNLDETQSKTGTAFYQPTRAKCFDIPNTKEIWLKCDIYTTANYANNDRIRIYSEDSNSVNGWSTNSSATAAYLLWHNGTSQTGKYSFGKNLLRSILLHMKSDATNGVVEYFFKHGDTDKFVGNVNAGDDFANVYIQMDGSNILVSNLIISNAPLDIDEDVAELRRNTVEFTADTARMLKNVVEISSDTKRNVVKPVSVDFDVVRNVKQIWRYENYGNADDLLVTGTTLAVTQDKSRYYTGFYQTQRLKAFNIPATKELWVKFDLYYGGTAKWRAYDRRDGKDTGVGRYTQANSLTSFINGPLEYTLNPTNTITSKQRKTYLLHMLSDATNGLVELWVDGVKYYSDDYASQGLIHSGNVNDGEDFANFYLQSDNDTNIFSNVIISNGEIGLNENTKMPVDFSADTARAIKEIWRRNYYGFPETREIGVPATNEIWIKFNVKTAVVQEREYIQVFHEHYYNDEIFENGLAIYVLNASILYTDMVSLPYNVVKNIRTNYSLQNNNDERFLLHMKSGVDDGLVEIFSGENLIGTYTGNVNNGNDFYNIGGYASGTNIKAYNFVISNARLTADVNAPFEVEATFSTLRIVNSGNFAEEIYFDTLRKVENAWRIENYGTADLTDNSGAETLAVGYSKSRTGYAYRHGDFSQYIIPSSDEVWIKLDFYFDSEVLVGEPKHKNFKVGVVKPQTGTVSNQAVFVGSQPSYSLINVNLPTGKDYGNTDYRGAADFENPVEYDHLYRLLVHIKSDSTDGVIEYWLDNGKYLSYVGNVNNGGEFTRAYVSMLNFAAYSPLISNVIISNKPVGIGENVAEVGGNVSGVYSTVRKILNPPLTWVYENYGTQDLILVEGKDYDNLDISQSRTGSAFTTLEKSKTFPLNSTNEIWAKFDFYIENIRNYYNWGNPDSKGTWWGFDFFNLGLNPDEDDIEIAAGIQIVAPGSTAYYGITPISGTQDVVQVDGSSQGNLFLLAELNDLNTCLLYMKSGMTDGVIKVWVNGELKLWYVGNVNNGNIFDNICLYSLDDFREIPATSYTVAYSTAAPLFSNVEISNSELTTSRNIELLFDTDRRLNSTKEILFDTSRRLTNAGNWRYENYGTANLLTSTVGETIFTDKSKAIYQQGFHQKKIVNCFGLPATNELWVKFDVYTSGSAWGALDYGNNATGIWSNAFQDLYFMAAGEQQRRISGVINEYQKQTVLLHMLSDSENGIVEAWVDGNLIYTYTGSTNGGDSFENFSLQSNDNETFFSNVIISNARIGLNENTKMFFSGLYDVQISVPKVLMSCFDTLRNISLPQDILFGALRDVKRSAEIFNDTCRGLKGQYSFDFDTVRSIPHEFQVMPIPIADFSAKQNTGDSTVQARRLKKVSLLADTPTIVVTPSTDNITEGTQSVEITFAAQQLTDQLRYTGVIPAVIMERIHGQYLDYVFSGRIEKIRKRGDLYSYECCSDVDEILYRQLDYKIPDNERWHRADENPDNEIFDYIPMGNASVHISHIAENMGLQPLFFFNDFVSTVDVNAGGVTYNDLIGNIFGWSSRIPHQIINVFIRGNNLFVVQRGYEPNIIDLTGAKHTVPNVDSELVRTAWGATTWSETETRERRGRFVVDSYEFAPPKPQGKSSGTSKDGYTFNSDGLVSQSRTVEGDTETTTTYEYTTLTGGRKFLVKEHTVVYEGSTKVDEKTTYHTPLEQGQAHSASYDGDGEYLGGAVGESTGDNRVSPYQAQGLLYKLGAYIYDKDGNQKYIKAIHYKREKIPEERKIYGITLFDTSFPVHGDDRLAEITAAINWLNRRTKETVSMSIYDYPHVIDFTDKIIFDGNEYFLESNTATTTPRIINRQDVTFARWY